ncbi:DeoR/GlpR family DNA-binding transcription regulator [Weissella soli]|uniref:DeoR/GlpR family DNA-binding transcription regulator n=1 Tax=Weissella soli TaxID=155866 RepID=UPI0035A19C49
MIIEERKEKILTILHKHKFMKLADLEAITRTSLSTLRRDLQDLETAGKVKRLRGGVQLLESLQTEPSMQQKQVVHSGSKQRIGKAAADLVQGGETIFLDAGTTTAEVIPYLIDKNPSITVVTNSVHHAARLSDLMIPTIIIGGPIKQTTDATIGVTAVEQIQHLAFDISFLGTNGIDAAHGLTTPDLEEAAIKSVVIKQTRCPYVLADASKFGSVAFVQTAALQDVTIITNQLADEYIALRETTEIIEVDKG